MTFSDFANLLHPIIGEGISTSDFARKILYVMVGEKNFDIIEKKSTNTYKAYFNGRTPINSFASEICSKIEPENFVPYLESFGDAVGEKLCTIFEPYIKGIDTANVYKEIAYYFDKIIEDAAIIKRKDSSNKDEPLDIPDEHTSDNLPYLESDMELLKEFNNDYEEIMLTLINGNYTTYLVNMSMPNKIKKLYLKKWKEKANDFITPTLKSDIFGILGVLDELSTNFISCNSNTSLITDQRIKVRNLYVKLHPEKYDNNIPYDIFLDDWNDNEF